MPESQSSLHHSVLLSNYAQDWRPPEEDWYRAPDIFPMVTVKKEFDDFMRLNPSTWRQTANAVVGPNGDVSRVNFYRDTDGSYTAKPYALEGVIDLKQRAAADDVLQYEKLQTDVPLVTLTNTIEKDAITAALTTANLGSSYETVAFDEKFDVLFGPNANPFQYIERKCRKIKRVTGRKPNRVILDDLVWQAIKLNPTSAVFLPVHTTPAGLMLLTPKIMEEKLEEVLEPGSIRLTSLRLENGRPPIAAASSDLRSVLKAAMIICRVEENPTLSDWSAFKCFCWVGSNDPETGLALEGGAPQAPIGVYTYPKPDLGQRGSVVVKVICNRAYVVGRTESLFVSLECVDSTNSALYGSELT